MGVLLVTRMPPEFVALRRKLLMLAEQVGGELLAVLWRKQAAGIAATATC